MQVMNAAGQTGMHILSDVYEANHVKSAIISSIKDHVPQIRVKDKIWEKHKFNKRFRPDIEEEVLVQLQKYGSNGKRTDGKEDNDIGSKKEKQEELKAEWETTRRGVELEDQLYRLADRKKMGKDTPDSKVECEDQTSASASCGTKRSASSVCEVVSDGRLDRCASSHVCCVKARKLDRFVKELLEDAKQM